MESKNINPAVAALELKKWLALEKDPKSDIDASPEEWREVFESMQRFPYTSDDDRLFDMQTMLLKGYVIFSRAGLWEEVISMVDWYLEDELFKRQVSKIRRAYEFKATAYIFTDRINIGLQYYINGMKKLGRSDDSAFWFVYGKILILLIKEEVYRDANTVASEEVIEFARELVRFYQPGATLQGILDPDHNNLNHHCTLKDVANALRQFPV